MLEDYKADSGTFEPVYTLEIQTLEDDVDRILDGIMRVHPLNYGRYLRNASVSATGWETTIPQENSTTTNHKKGYQLGTPMSYPCVELKISIERDLDALQRVMDVILELHHYEQPVIFLREDWASRSNYDPHRNNPNRWWNTEKGLPRELSKEKRR